MALDPTLRAGDDDRDRISAVLRDAYAEGRLRREEFEARLQGAYEAMTIADLLTLVQDLPDRGGLLSELRQPASPPAPAGRPAPEPGQSWRGLTPGVAAMALLILVFLLVVVTRMAALRLWPVWLVAGVALFVVFAGRGGNNSD